MNVREWIEYQLQATHLTEFDFWHKCWKEVCGRPCASNQVIKDLEQWRRTRFVPTYIWSCFEKAKNASRTLPPKAVP